MKNIDPTQLIDFGNAQNDPSRFNLPLTLQNDGYAQEQQPLSVEFNGLFRNVTQAAYTVYLELERFLENNGITPDENKTQQIYDLLYQQQYNQGNLQPWTSNVSYKLGAKVIEVASWPGLGANPEVVHIVYKSNITNNLNNALPADFISDANWSWVDVEQPQDDIRIDLSGVVGTGGRVSVAANVAKNWAICNGQTVTKPDGTTYTTPNTEDKTIVLTSSNPLEQGGSHNWVFNVIGDTNFHTLNINEIPNHFHTTGVSAAEAIYGGGTSIGGRVYPPGGTDSFTNANTSSVGGNGGHRHSINFSVSSADNRVPFEKWIPIIRVW